MKNLFFIILLSGIFLISCDKSSSENWSEEDKAYYNNVLVLQDEAVEKYESWLTTMDSLEAVKQLKEFFLADSTVLFAEIGSQGIGVQYSNGMRGGILLNPRDYPGEDSLPGGLNEKSTMPGDPVKSLVSNKKGIFLNPHYWERKSYADPMMLSFSIYSGKVKVNINPKYKTEECTVDRFTELSGYGLIHIYSHGMAWPNDSLLEFSNGDVLLMTGEETNIATAAKYIDDILNGDVAVVNTNFNNSRKNIYFISENFVASHNDFSKDTIMFIGGFCYSFMGSWPMLQESFANGIYTGHDWYVRTNWNCYWAREIYWSMSDTFKVEPLTPQWWISQAVPEKNYWEENANRFVSIHYTGDPDLTLWKDSALYYGKRHGGGIIFHLEENGKHGLIMAENDQSTGAPFGCFETLIGGTSGEFGTGQANTTALVNGCGDAGTAARICDELVLNGYSDWYLPSAKELDYMYYASDDFGNFSTGSYYSSTEANARMAVALTFSDGQYYNEFKNVNCYIRAIRAF